MFTWKATEQLGSSTANEVWPFYVYKMLQIGTKDNTTDNIFVHVSIRSRIILIDHLLFSLKYSPKSLLVIKQYAHHDNAITIYEIL